MRLSLSHALRFVKKAFYSHRRNRFGATKGRFSTRSRLFLEPLENRRLLVADLAITKLDMPDPAVPGGALTYTIQVTNSGDVAGTGTVADTFPANFTGFAFTSSATNASGNSASGTTNINDVVTVQPGGTITYTVTGTI